MSDDAPEKSSKTWLYVTAMLVSVPLLYVASIGPAVVLAERKIIGEPVLEFCYSPLEWVVEATGTADAFEAYITVWMKLTGTPEP